MLNLEQVKIRQKKVVELQISNANLFIDEKIKPHDQIGGCLLSGSVARGDFWVGPRGGAVDLIIFVDNLATFDAENNLGKNLDHRIPGHFTQYKDIYYQIKIYDGKYFENFERNNEAEKYAFLESKILFDRNGNIEELIYEIENLVVQKEIRQNLKDNLSHAHYLINDYKVDRWRRREAIVQLNQNLNKSIELCIRCLFYVNGKYSPAEDRALYYSFTLPKKPMEYNQLIEEVTIVRAHDHDEYLNREKTFKEKFLAFFES